MAFIRLQILVVMAVAAELENIFLQQCTLRRLVRVVAGSAILNDIVLELRLLQKIVVADPAEFRHGLF